MSPLQIEILLQFHYSPKGYTGHAVGSPAYVDAMRDFEKCGLLARPVGVDQWILTPRGQDAVDRLCAVSMLRDDDKPGACVHVTCRNATTRKIECLKCGAILGDSPGRGGMIMPTPSDIPESWDR